MIETALIECDWYDMPTQSRPWWARVECAGEVENGACLSHVEALPDIG